MNPGVAPKPRRACVAALACGLGAAVAFSGCGVAADSAADPIAGRTLTIYVSVPLNGASSVSGEAVLNAARIALAQIHGRIGRYRIVLKALDDATPQARKWDPGQTTADAHEAVFDRTTIGYVGDFNSGASAVSIPLLNRAEIAQVSPWSTAVGLTSAAPGASPGEPQKYYPTGARTFARVVPNDSVQAEVMVKLQLASGCRRTYVLQDGEVDGEDLATTFELAARAASLPVVAVQMYDAGASSYASLAHSVAQTGVNCVMLSALTESSAVLLTEQIAAALPNALIFGSAGLAETTYTDPAQGGLPLALDSRVLLSAPAPADNVATRRFLAAYARRFGTPEPAAVFGYAAATLLLSAVDRATGGGTRAAVRANVVAALFTTRDRPSVLGSYSIDRDGDTTLDRYVIYKVLDGRLEPWETITG